MELRGVRDDVMLLSYLVNPTHGSHTLPDIAARTTSRALIHQPTKANPADPKRLPEAAGGDCAAGGGADNAGGRGGYV